MAGGLRLSVIAWRQGGPFKALVNSFGVALLVGLQGCRDVPPIPITVDSDSLSLAAESRHYSFEEPCMGTLFRIDLYAASEEVASKASSRAFDVAHALNARFTDYDPRSELMELCRSGSNTPGTPLPLSPELWEALKLGAEIERLSEGAFDPAVGHLTKIWRRSVRKGRLPQEGVLAEALARTGMRHIELAESQPEAIFLRSDVLLDLGGLGKGIAADAMLDVLSLEGVESVVVLAGGDVRAGAPPPGEDGWAVTIRPYGSSSGQGIRKLRIHHCGVSTSGSVHQSVEIDGRHYSHIVDPKTGIGIAPGIAATVVAPNTALSDALATAMCVVGSKRGLVLAEKAGVEVLFVERGEGLDGKVTGSLGFPAE